MMNATIEKGDIIAIKNASSPEPFAVEVLKVLVDYEKPGGILRFDYINRSEPSAFRRVGWPSEIIRIIKKGTITPPPDPKQQRAYDDPVVPPTKVIIVDGQEYVAKDRNNKSGSPAHIVNHEVTSSTHAAATSEIKPTLKRGKTDKDK